MNCSSVGSLHLVACPLSSCKAFLAPFSRVQFPQACIGPRVWIYCHCTEPLWIFHGMHSPKYSEKWKSSCTTLLPATLMLILFQSWEEKLCFRHPELWSGVLAALRHCSPSPVPTHSPSNGVVPEVANRRKSKLFSVVNSPGGPSSPEQHSERLRRQPGASPCALGDSWELAWITKFQGTEGWGKQCFKWTCLKLPCGRWTLATHISPEQSEKLVVCLNNWVAFVFCC